MRHCILKIVVVSILLFGILGVDVVNANIDETCNSVTNVFLNKTYCDRKEIVIEGEVSDLIFTISDAEHKFTTFNISEDNNNIIVFSYGYLRIGDGDTVRVTGTYYIEYLYKNYTFYDEIVTTLSQVVILSPSPPPNYTLIGLIIITLGISILIVFHLKKKNHDLEKSNKYLEKKNQEKLRKKINYGKGYDFEKYFSELMGPKKWSIENWTRDVSGELGRPVDSDTHPDFTFKHLESGKIVSIECKYRTQFDNNTDPRIRWAEKYQISKYNKFEDENGHSVYVVIGLGGKPSKPERMFLAPLYSLKYPLAKESYLRKFERNVTSSISLEELNK